MKRILNFNLLEEAVLEVFDTYNRPMKIEDLINFLTEYFIKNNRQNVRFCIEGLVQKGKLFQHDNCVYNKQWDGKMTPADLLIPNYLIGLKEEALLFLRDEISCQGYLSISNFFYFVHRYYVGLIKYEDTPEEYFQHILYNCSKSLTDIFYAELNNDMVGWFATFFDKPDCHLIIKNVCELHKGIKINLLLIPNKNGTYNKAYQELLKFKTYIKYYLNGPYDITNELLLKTDKKGENKYE